MEYGLVVVWLLTYLVLGFATLPLAGLVFPRLSDRGGALAIPLALAVIGIVGYLVGHVAFGWPALFAGLAVLVGTGILDGARADLDYRGYAEAATVFSVAFLFLVAVRAVDPAVHPIGGEKFLDFGLLKSLLRTGRLPPEDVWFAGEPVQYYYGGHMIASLLTRFTVTDAAFAYNLGLAGYYAAFVTAAWGLASNVAAAAGGPRRLAGGLGAFFAGLASNLVTAGKLFLWALPAGLGRVVAGLLGVPAEVRDWTPGQFSYWDASRVIRRVPGDPDAGHLISEFPLFAWLNGDLHAHMMSTPFTLLVAALLYSYWLTPEEDRRTRRALVFGAIPPVAGLLGVVNTWSFPTTAGLTMLVLLFAPADPWTLLPDELADRRPSTGDTSRVRARFTEEIARIGTGAGLAVGMLAIAALWALPFWFESASGRPLAFFPERSPLGELLLVHGTFLLVFVPYLGRRWLSDAADPLRNAGMAVLAALLAWFAGFAAIAVFAPLLLVAWILVRTDEETGFETVLVVAGIGLVILVEFVYVEAEAAPGRINTVFKTYAQVWALWAPAAGVALGRIATPLPDAPSLSDTPLEGAQRWHLAGTAFAVVIVVTASLYGALALANHFERGGPAASLENPTLDATAFVAVHHPDEAPAIRWLDGLEGQPNIVTAAPGGYRWRPQAGKGASAPSSLTGVPTVVGWFHEIGYRGREPFEQRVADVRTIYMGTPQLQARLLRQYDVRYIYVGPAERARYDPITVAEVQGVERLHRLGDVVIYRVHPDELPAG